MSCPGADGKRTRIVETRGASVVQWDYDYDALGRLRRERRSGVFARDVSYTYDADSNRVSETDNLTSSTKQYFYYAHSQLPLPFNGVRGKMLGCLCW
ncbi:hypothetical protein ACFL34_00110 [Candidatus Sumerlaeota bacterium]